MYQYTNHLIQEKSPYLLQHAHNPVDWYPWGEEAFHKASTENKPVFLSIGYSTCHWCHVMKRVSFEDAEVTRLMNEIFVSIKVDREERPDIDNVYMTVCQMLTGSGGWPLTIIMTPDKKPFFAGTYINREGMLKLISQIKNLWSTRNVEITKSANQIIGALKEISDFSPGDKLNESTLHRAYQELANRFDENYGGFSNSPKFPSPHNLFFLLRYGKRTGNKKPLEMVEKTLQSMQRGGIYDHIGGGFHRYATDDKWLVPHFEKMLYDQALIALAYTEAYQVTQNEAITSNVYKNTAHQIFRYVLRDMSAPEGGFYSAEDAESEGEEGKFYCWTREEIQNALDNKSADLVINIFNLEKGGNFLEEDTQRKTAANILYLKKSWADLATELKIPEDKLTALWDEIRQKLFSVRKKRVHPGKDDKILTDWNGLMIASLAVGARVLANPEYLNAAKKAVSYINQHLRRQTDGRLLHFYRTRGADISANLDDYAFFIWGLMELYETTLDVNYLQFALNLNQDMLKYFWDKKASGFYFTADDAENLIVRQKEIYDGAIPSGNSVALLNLLRLSRITGNYQLEEKATAITRIFSQHLNRSPSSFTQLMVGFDFLVGPTYEVVIAGNSRTEDTKTMLAALRTQFIPNKVVLFRPTELESPELTRLAEFTKYCNSINNKATAYVCVNYKCKLPTTEINTMLQLLEENKPEKMENK